MLLEGLYPKAFGANEWFVLCDKTDLLQTLCKKLDSAVELESKMVKKRDKKIDADVDVFDSEDNCRAFLTAQVKGIFK